MFFHNNEKRSLFMAVKVTIGEKLGDLIAAKHISYQEFAKETNISQATISDIVNDVKKGYSYEYFVVFANYFGVSTDYLLGLSDVETPDIKLRYICDYTGLSENTIKILHTFKDSIFVEFCNYYISQMCRKDIINYADDDTDDHGERTKIGKVIIDCCDLTRLKNTVSESVPHERLFDLPEHDYDALQLFEDCSELFNDESIRYNGTKSLITESFNNVFNDFVEMKAKENYFNDYIKTRAMKEEKMKKAKQKRKDSLTSQNRKSKR